MAGTRFPGVIIAMLALWTGIAQAQAPAPEPPPVSVHAADAYAIYSLLLADALPTPRYPLAIAANTLSANEIPSQPREQLVSEGREIPEFEQAVDDYHQRGTDHAQIQHMLNLNRPYTLLSGEEMARFHQNPGTVAGLPTNTRIVAFSGVFFNPGQTAALVYMSHICASSCGAGDWIFLVREDNTWIRASRATPNAADIYAIYSLLMLASPFEGISSSQATHFAIAAETVGLEQMNPMLAPDAQLQAPPSNPRAFHEALQDFYSRRNERIQLQPRLQLDRPYKLLTADEIEQLRTVLTGIDPGSSLKDTWAGYVGITFFSEVYFNRAHTAALVFMNNFCASLCSNGQWVYVEKHDGHWIRRSGLNL